MTEPISRRALLHVAAALGVAGPKTITAGVSAASSIMQASAIGGVQDLKDPFELAPYSETAEVTPAVLKRMAVLRAFEQADHYKYRVKNNIPEHIDSKRSWSPAYKEYAAIVELKEMDRLLNLLKRDESFLNKVATMLGIADIVDDDD